MEWLNYHHLLYFWMVAREGSVSAASRRLRLAQPTVSAQVKQLEQAFGQPLLQKAGRGLTLTEAGRVVYGYADRIFRLGQELQHALRELPERAHLRLTVGISVVLPKILSYRLLEGLLSREPRVELICRAGSTERLLAELAVEELDLVLADAPIGPHVHVRAFNHPLGESAVSFLGTRGLAERYQARFPASLAGAPLLLPTPDTVMGASIERWLERHGIRADVVATFDDSALMKVLGEHGHGIFPAPTLGEREVCDVYGVEVVGRTPELTERVFAISTERRVRNPLVAELIEGARAALGSR
jgi:LysR family transcriptional regulator, transcriptional activator of nhaA